MVLGFIFGVCMFLVIVVIKSRFKKGIERLGFGRRWRRMVWEGGKGEIMFFGRYEVFRLKGREFKEVMGCEREGFEGGRSGEIKLWRYSEERIYGERS